MLNLTKPSDLLTAAIAGIDDALSDPNFKFHMDTFGGVTNNGLCCGCVATATLQKLGGLKFTYAGIAGRLNRAAALRISDWRVEQIETAIDSARCGDYSDLYSYFGVPDSKVEDEDLTEEEMDDPLLIRDRFIRLRDQMMLEGD